MTRKKKYFESENAEFCYTLDYHKRKARKEKKKTMHLFQAVPLKNAQFFWCKAYMIVAEKGQCGAICEHYKAMNGRNSGVCANFGSLYEKGKEVTIKVGKP